MPVALSPYSIVFVRYSVNKSLLGNTLEQVGGPMQDSYLERFMNLHINSTSDERGSFLNAEDFQIE